MVSTGIFEYGRPVEVLNDFVIESVIELNP